MLILPIKQEWSRSLQMACGMATLSISGVVGAYEVSFTSDVLTGIKPIWQFALLQATALAVYFAVCTLYLIARGCRRERTLLYCTAGSMMLLISTFSISWNVFVRAHGDWQATAALICCALLYGLALPAPSYIFYW